MSDIQAIREAISHVQDMLPIKADRRNIYAAEKIYDVDGEPEQYVTFVCFPATDVWKNVIVMSVNNIGALAERLTAAEARAEAAEAMAENLDALVDARHDLAYANGFRAGWNAGAAYEQCQPVPFERKASGNPEYYLQTLATMDRRSADALAILAARTLKGAPDESV